MRKLKRHVVLQVTIAVTAKDRFKLNEAVAEARVQLKDVAMENGDLYDMKAIRASVRRVESYDPATIEKPQRKVTI